MIPSKSIRVNTGLWQRAKVQAAKDQESLQAFTERALAKHLGEREQIRVTPVEWGATK